MIQVNNFKDDLFRIWMLIGKFCLLIRLVLILTATCPKQGETLETQTSAWVSVSMPTPVQLVRIYSKM